MKIHTEQLADGVGFEMVFVDGGIFEMGSDDPEAWAFEKPKHQVKVSDFFIGKFPVTQGLWKGVMGSVNNRPVFEGPNRPVGVVSWNDCQSISIS